MPGTLRHIRQDNPAGYELALYSIPGSCAKNQPQSMEAFSFSSM
jgi:hypothetical protein